MLSGEFTVVNQHLLQDLTDMGLWDDSLKQLLIAHNGSVQHIPQVPDKLRAIYKTVWEIKQRVLVDMAADRGAFICQSQSFNVHMSDANFGKLTSLHFHTWRKGLKTGTYYLRTRAAADAIKFTVDAEALAKAKESAKTTEDKAKADKDYEQKMAAMVCSLENKDACLMCGS